MKTNKNVIMPVENKIRRKVTMKAVTQDRYGGPEVFQISRLPVPKIENNQLLVRVYAAPVTAAGSFIREGVPYFGRLFMGLTKPKSRVPGTGFSGEIEAIGDQVTKFKEGDLVFGEAIFQEGTMANYVCITEDDVVAIKPSNITHVEACPVSDGHLTSINFLQEIANLQPAQRILIIGASGSLGSAAVQLARHMGAYVTGVCSGRNVELIKSLGAHHVIDYQKVDFTKLNEKYDVIYDTVGKSSFSACKSRLSDRGIYMSPVLNFKLLLHVLWTSILTKKKAKFSATGMLPKEKLNNMLQALKHLFENDAIKTVVDRTYPMDQIAEASKYVDTGRKIGNVVITIDEN